MDIEYEKACSWDYLQITDISNGIAAKICGDLSQYSPSNGPLCISTNSSSINVLFNSDEIMVATGFDLLFVSSGTLNTYSCGSYYSLNELAISSRYS